MNTIYMLLLHAWMQLCLTCCVIFITQYGITKITCPASLIIQTWQVMLTTSWHILREIKSGLLQLILIKVTN